MYWTSCPMAAEIGSRSSCNLSKNKPYRSWTCFILHTALGANGYKITNVVLLDPTIIIYQTIRQKALSNKLYYKLAIFRPSPPPNNLSWYQINMWLTRYLNDWPRLMDNYSVAGCRERPISAHFSSWFMSLLFFTYCAVALCWYPIAVYCASLRFVSLFLPLPIISVSHTLALGVILFPSLSLCSPYLSVSLSLLFFLAHPHSPPGFLSLLSMLHKLKNWYICSKTNLCHWAKRWVQSQPCSITESSHRADAFSTHRRPKSRSSTALISRTCFSCNIRAVSRFIHRG